MSQCVFYTFFRTTFCYTAQALLMLILKAIRAKSAWWLFFVMFLFLMDTPGELFALNIHVQDSTHFVTTFKLFLLSTSLVFLLQICVSMCVCFHSCECKIKIKRIFQQIHKLIKCQADWMLRREYSVWFLWLAFF